MVNAYYSAIKNVKTKRFKDYSMISSRQNKKHFNKIVLKTRE